MPFDSSGEPPHLASSPAEPPLDTWSDLWGLTEPDVPAVAVVLAIAAAVAAIATLYLAG
ncbi:MAG TPA: hypothetical protein VGM87_22280 [Roseomonas sp.]|jgi:hypothetical protein